MDLRQMRYFESVVRHRSFTQAAAKLYVAQPALGLQIRKLEDELGVQLLVRNTRGVEPTEAGLLLLEKVRAILASVESARRELIDYSGPVRGRVSIGITPTIASILALPLLERCRAELPEVSINLVEDLGSVLTEWLQMDRLDMAIAFSVPPTLGLTAKVLAQDRAYLIHRATDRLAHMKPVTFEEAVRRPLVLPSMPNRLRQFIEDEARAAKIDLDIALEVQSPSTILNLVEHGFGATVMSLVAVRSQLEARGLCARPIVEPEVAYPLSLVRSDSASLSKGEAALQAIIEDILPPLLADRA